MLSGGQDSSFGLKEHYETSRSVYGGQRHHLLREISLRSRVFVITSRYVSPLGHHGFNLYNVNQSKKKGEGSQYFDGHQPPLLSFAQFLPKQRCVTGGQTNFSGTDCRVSLSNPLMLLSNAMDFVIKAPLMWLDKAKA